MPVQTMRRIDESRLESDLGYRFEYLTEFMGFTPEDIAAIHESAAYLAPLVPALVNAVYDKLFGYDATKRHFMPRQSGYDGEIPLNLEDLEQDHPQIQFRKSHLATYLTKLVTAAYNMGTVRYLDNVGKIHTADFGNPGLVVPLVQMNALMGFVADAVVATLQGVDAPQEKKDAMIRAFNKLLWLQNDLIVRHYAA